MSEEEKRKLKDAFIETKDSDLTYNKSIEDIDYTVLTKGMAADKTWKILGCTMCMFNYKFENCPCILIVFSYYTKGDAGQKDKAGKTIEIISLLQDVFTTIDFSGIIELKSEPFVYVIAIKKI